MTKPVLLDTCAALWVGNRSKLRDQALAELRTASKYEGGILVSPVSAWEIGSLVSRGRLALALDPAPWFRTLLASGIQLASLPPEVLIASSFLPGSTLKDPADRLLAATARAVSYRLMTRDALLLTYAAEGHMHAIEC